MKVRLRRVSKWVLFGPTKRRVPLQKEHTSMLGMSTPGKIGTVAEALRGIRFIKMVCRSSE